LFRTARASIRRCPDDADWSRAASAGLFETAGFLLSRVVAGWKDHRVLGLNCVGLQAVAVGEERPKCEMWTGEYQMFTMDSEGEPHQLTNTTYMAKRPSNGRFAAVK